MGHQMLGDFNTFFPPEMLAGLPAVLLPWIGVLVLFGLVTTALNVWFYWRIFERAGHSGWWGLFAGINGASIFLNGFLAFARWPREKKK